MDTRTSIYLREKSGAEKTSEEKEEAQEDDELKP
jgi:hypothetical protein